jgi:phosphatidylserine decarboxylase
VFYLHPRDCHRVQVPADSRLVRTRHIPGSRFPVVDWSERLVKGIYSRNERLVFDFALPDGARLSLVMVAALGVGNLDSPYAPPDLTATTSRREFDPPPSLHRGEDLASFKLGSTVVLLWSADAVELDETLFPGPVVFGQKLGSTFNCCETDDRARGKG